MLDWLPGADPSTRAEGERLVRRALELFKRCLTKGLRKGATIAVGESEGVEVAVVFHVKLKTAERLAGRLRKIGVAAVASSDDVHAEMALHQQEPKVNVIGISHPKGPCPSCETYFGNTPDGFANVYWDTKGWLV